MGPKSKFVETKKPSVGRRPIPTPHSGTPIPPLDIDLPPLNPGSISAAFSKGKAAAASASSIEDQLAANTSRPSFCKKASIQEENDLKSPDRTPVDPSSL
ncbi:hypothetical protein Hypma_006370 [Hypsizygus marmoreus]|uniref:Uncharacterized protein n=1 Tax=Hypsizygus marmoreus TaxID=39966 RepID=A0A369JVA9_HYPMA|nr:hypothetical protein Hypma_006370 [Hypsizygus marmoreus]